MMLMTRTLSLMPGTPGRRQQMPRTIRSIDTPACDARYSASIVSVSATAFILATIRPPRPARANAASRSISSITRCRMLDGATSSFR